MIEMVAFPIYHPMCNIADLIICLQIDIFNGFMEEYHGPSKSVGLIIMAGVAYYIPDKKRMVKQVMDWLKTGGQFIMTHIPPNTPITKGQDPIREFSCF